MESLKGNRRMEGEGVEGERVSKKEQKRRKRRGKEVGKEADGKQDIYVHRCAKG